MRVKIYQINGARDEKREKFLGTDARERLHLPQAIDPAIYDEVFNAEIDESTPEEIYRRFNSEGHPLHRGHSLSVSDVVVTENGAYFCDDVGFRQIDFDETQTKKPDNLMRVVYVEPGRPAYEAEIAHDIHAEQKAVGGFIECVYNKDGTVLVCNDESKLLGMEGNRRLGNGRTVIAGPFFVCGLTEDDFRGLTDTETQTYLDRFSLPENISREEVEADMGFTFYAF